MIHIGKKDFFFTKLPEYKNLWFYGNKWYGRILWFCWATSGTGSDWREWQVQQQSKHKF